MAGPGGEGQVSHSLRSEHIMWTGRFQTTEEEPWGSSPPPCPPTFKPRVQCPRLGGTQEGSWRVCLTQSQREGHRGRGGGAGGNGGCSPDLQGPR